MPRALYTKTKSAPLAEAEKTKLLNEHLPYRLELLKLGAASCPAKDKLSSAVVEAGIVSGRLLLQFLGLSIERKSGLHLVEKREYFERPKGITDEVKITDVGGTFVDPSKLSEEDKHCLARFHEGASKACAHFTWESRHGLDVETILHASDLIDGLIQEHCPKPGE